MQQNTIKITGDGNIVIQDATGRDITINQNDPQLFENLQKLGAEDIAVLQQMIKEQSDKFSEMFKIIISRITSKKNIVYGNITAKSFNIGDEIHYHDAEQKKTKNIGTVPPKPAVFIGRDSSPDEIHQQLCNNQNLLLLVNGESGIGKTTLAAQYYHQYEHFYEHLIWLVADNGIDKSFATLAIHLNIQFPEGSTAHEQLQLIINIIKSLSRPVLLVLDNADRLDDLTQNHQLLRQLPNTHILITSRINNFAQIANYPVETLTEEYAIQLFKQHFKAFKEEETPLLIKLLPAIGFNTLVIELLAKNLNNYNDELEQYYPLNKLLEEIQQKGLLALSKTDKVTTDWKLQTAKPEDIVLAMYDIAKLDGQKQQILSLFAVLPLTALPYQHIKQFLPDTENPNKELKKLAQEGWFTYHEPSQSFKTNPIIAQVTRNKNTNRIKQDILPMIKTLVEKLKYEPGVGHIDGNFEEIKQYITYAENIARYPEFIDKDYLLIYERIGNFFTTYGNLDKALKYFEEFTKLMEELYESYPNHVGFKNGLAISYEKLGSTHASLGNLDKALKYFEEYNTHEKELYESYPNNVEFKNNLAISYSKLGLIYADELNNKEKGLEFLLKTKQLYTELHTQFPAYKEFENNYNWTINKIKQIKEI